MRRSELRWIDEEEVERLKAVEVAVSVGTLHEMPKHSPRPEPRVATEPAPPRELPYEQLRGLILIPIFQVLYALYLTTIGNRKFTSLDDRLWGTNRQYYHDLFDPLVSSSNGKFFQALGDWGNSLTAYKNINSFLSFLCEVLGMSLWAIFIIGPLYFLCSGPAWTYLNHHPNRKPIDIIHNKISLKNVLELRLGPYIWYCHCFEEEPDAEVCKMFATGTVLGIFLLPFVSTLVVFILAHIVGAAGGALGELARWVFARK